MPLDEGFQCMHGTVSTLLSEHFRCFDWVQQELASTFTCNNSENFPLLNVEQTDVADLCI